MTARKKEMTGHALKQLPLNDLVVHILGDIGNGLEDVEIFRTPKKNDRGAQKILPRVLPLREKVRGT